MIEDFLRLDKQKQKIILARGGAVASTIFPITVGYYMGAKFLFGWNIYIAGILAGLTGTFWASNSRTIHKEIQKILKLKTPLSKNEYLSERNKYNWKAIVSVFVLIIEFILIRFLPV